MKKLLVTLAVVALIVGVTGMAQATPFSGVGYNSTIVDVHGSSGSGRGNEDNETEPGTLQEQTWDLEGGFFDVIGGSEITMVGGFDFWKGTNYGGHTYTSGDIFIDLNGDSVPNTGGDQGNYGFEYALRFFDTTWTAHGSDHHTFGVTLFDLTDVTTEDDFKMPTDILKSSPWRVDEGEVSSVGTIANAGDYWAGLSDNQVGATGWKGNDTHYAVRIDLDSIFSAATGSTYNDLRGDNGPIFQFTMECGNDQLRFQDPVPEPGTLLLLGAGLIGLVALGRKRVKK